MENIEHVLDQLYMVALQTACTGFPGHKAVR